MLVAAVSLQRRSSPPSAIAAVAVLTAIAMSGSALAQGDAGRQRSHIDPTRLARIVPRMQEFVDEGRMAGAVMLLAKDGEIVLHEAVGYADLERREPVRTDTIFHIASQTKPFSAIAAMTLVEAGHLRLSDPISHWLPERAAAEVIVGRDDQGQPILEPAARPATIRDLLSHSSGAPGGLPGDLLASLDAKAREMAREPLVYQPGENHMYSNSGIIMLSRIIELAAEQPYDAYLKEHVLEPLGMSDTFYHATPAQRLRVAQMYETRDGKLEKSVDDPLSLFRYPFGAGGLLSTAENLFRFYQTMLDGGALDGARILSPAAVAAMTSDVTRDRVALGAPFSGQGLGFAIVKDPVGTRTLPLLRQGTFGHGGGWGTLSWADPETRFVGVFLTHSAFEGWEFAEVFVAMSAAAIVW